MIYTNLQNSMQDKVCEVVMNGYEGKSTIQIHTGSAATYQ